jgi:hypothetical protein
MERFARPYQKPSITVRARRLDCLEASVDEAA